MESSTETTPVGNIKATASFRVPVRPTSIPQELIDLFERLPKGVLRLEHGPVVRLEQGTSCGISTVGNYSPGEAIQVFEQTLERQRGGQFHPAEAAQIIADAEGFDPASYLLDLKAAFQDKELIVRNPDTQMPRKATAPWRPCTDLVAVDDVNAWLQAAGVSYRFPTVPAASLAPSSRRTAKASRASQQGEAIVAPMPSTQRATNARWAHLDAFKAKALDVAKSKTFTSYAAAAREAALQLDPKPKPKSRPDSEDTYYPPGKIEDWLKEAGWTPAAAGE